MTYVYPFTVEFLADLLAISSVTWDIQRNDEISGGGDGRVWQAELAPPLWKADIELATDLHDELKRIAARVRKLHGSQYAFMIYDPTSMYPQSDKKGLILGARTVTIKSVGANRSSISLKGLTAAYALTEGDKIQITYGSDPVMSFFLEVSEAIVANGDGETAEFEIFPHVPVGVAAENVASLKKPACKMFIMPNSFNPGTSRNAVTGGATIKAVERRR